MRRLSVRHSRMSARNRHRNQQHLLLLQPSGSEVYNNSRNFDVEDSDGFKTHHFYTQVIEPILYANASVLFSSWKEGLRCTYFRDRVVFGCTPFKTCFFDTENRHCAHVIYAHRGFNMVKCVWRIDNGRYDVLRCSSRENLVRLDFAVSSPFSFSHISRAIVATLNV